VAAAVGVVGVGVRRALRMRWSTSSRSGPFLFFFFVFCSGFWGGVFGDVGCRWMADGLGFEGSDFFLCLGVGWMHGCRWIRVLGGGEVDVWVCGCVGGVVVFP
jgi:hypothetical protein